ncbi:MAG: tRNA (adenosine(37)-N6)-dimethylallyltransferase MiaA [Candidatus Moraniibacteriota bacterium]|nr:MAG: tRNA (adenosine(37)-N6)-dimethylallyltransferase MiaA [Candidatus Moranbacteria bacterium]
MQGNSQKALAVLGPTASGKSDVAIQIAKKFEGEIISCDSRQIYRGMSIGSGKVIRDDYPKDAFFSEGVQHHMIDIVSPRTEYNISKFRDKSLRILPLIIHKNHLPILCGGTGFWAEFLIENRELPHIPPNTELRKKLSTYSLKDLQEKLLSLDSAYYNHIDTANPVRLIRAIEITLHKKQFPENNESAIEEKVPHKKKNESLQWDIVILNPSKELLYKNIEIRLDQRLQEGMLDEVYTLHNENRISWNRLESFGLEYRWVSRYLKKEISYEGMRAELLKDIHHYTKRQLTWLRRWERQGRIFHWAETKEEALRIADLLCTKRK